MTARGIREQKETRDYSAEAGSNTELCRTAHQEDFSHKKRDTVAAELTFLPSSFLLASVYF